MLKHIDPLHILITRAQISYTPTIVTERGGRFNNNNNNNSNDEIGCII